MKNILNKLVNGKDNRLSGLIALAVVLSIALGCNCTKGLDLGNASSSSNSSSDNPFNTSSTKDDSDGVPGDALLNALIKETTADFAAAISSGDFSNMYEKASMDFKSTYTKDQLQDSFKVFIAKKRQVLPILAKAIATDPEFTSTPRVRGEQNLEILVTEGKYATKPLPVTFNYEYVKRDGSWKLLVLKIYIR
ncbi:MAG: hypothetical protein PSX80_00075 [bacterium]|nr:hypothetical protein [bacterium]